MAKSKVEEVGYNFTAQDKIWKDHCENEMKKAGIWEKNWSFLKTPYKELIKEDMDRLVDRDRPLAELPPHMRVRPATPKTKYYMVEASPVPFPRTTASEVGWRSGQSRLSVERFANQRYPKGSILKQLNWPAEAIG